jgi:hypothetical protein
MTFGRHDHLGLTEGDRLRYEAATFEHLTEPFGPKAAWT